MIWAAMFPDWVQFAEAAMADGMAERGMSEEQITQMIQSTAFMPDSRTASSASWPR